MWIVAVLLIEEDNCWVTCTVYPHERKNSKPAGESKTFLQHSGAYLNMPWVSWLILAASSCGPWGACPSDSAIDEHNKTRYNLEFTLWFSLNTHKLMWWKGIIAYIPLSENISTFSQPSSAFAELCESSWVPPCLDWPFASCESPITFVILCDKKYLLTCIFIVGTIKCKMYFSIDAYCFTTYNVVSFHLLSLFR